MQSWSHWEKAAYQHNDIVIVGAGIVGLFTAYYISEKFPNRQITVLDRHSLAAGASTKNAGFACFGSVTEIEDDLRVMDHSELIHLIAMRWNGLQRLLSVVKRENIDFGQHGGIELFDNKDQFDDSVKNLDQYNDMVEQATGLKGCFSVEEKCYSEKLHKEFIFNQYEGQLNPYKLISFLRGLLVKKQVRFVQGLNVEEWTENGNISIHLSNGETMFADQLIIATNAFTKKLYPEVDLTPYRNQVLITEPINNLPYKGCFHYNKGYTYFRNVGNRLLIGGFRDIDMLTEQTVSFGLTNKIQEALVDFASSRLGLKFKVSHRWSGILASGPVKSAITKELSNNVFLGVRLGGMGVAIGSEVAYKISSLID